MKKYESYKNSGIAWIGKIPSSWDLCCPKYNLQLQKGRKPSETTLEPNGDFPYLTMDVLRGRENAKTEYPIDNIGLVIINEGQILVLWDGANAGEITLAKTGYLSSTMALVSHNENYHSRYLYYLLKGCEQVYKDIATGTTIPHLDSSYILDYPYPIPSLIEQESIARYLDNKVTKIDESIGTIDNQIEDLKKYRQSIISEAVTKGLDKNTSMKDSGVRWIGSIPSGWSTIPMKQYFYMKGRIGWQGLKANEFIEDGPYLVTGTDFKNGRVNWDTCYHISEERYNEAPEIHVEKGDLLITKDGTVGKLAYIEEKPEKVSLNSHLLILRPTKDDVNNHYVYWALQSNVFKNYTGVSQNGSIMESLSQEKIGSFIMMLPSYVEQEQIANYLEVKIAKVDCAIEALTSQKEDLCRLKQAIISEAVTGKIDVRDWKPSNE